MKHPLTDEVHSSDVSDAQMDDTYIVPAHGLSPVDQAYLDALSFACFQSTLDDSSIHHHFNPKVHPHLLHDGLPWQSWMDGWTNRTPNERAVLWSEIKQMGIDVRTWIPASTEGQLSHPLFFWLRSMSDVQALGAEEWIHQVLDHTNSQGHTFEAHLSTQSYDPSLMTMIREERTFKPSPSIKRRMR